MTRYRDDDYLEPVDEYVNRRIGERDRWQDEFLAQRVMGEIRPAQQEQSRPVTLRRAQRRLED